jgi:hypothetical protein
VDLARERGRDGRGIGVRDADEDQESLADLAYDLAVHRHAGSGHGLHYRSHRPRVPQRRGRDAFEGRIRDLPWI